MTFLNGKKGNAVIDTAFILIVLLVLGVSALIGNLFLQDVNENIQDSSFSNETKEKMNSLSDNYPSYMDNLFFTAFILLWLVAVILSFLIDAHPIFIVIVVILLIFVLIVAGVMTNAYEEVSSESQFSPNLFPKMDFVLSNLLLFILFIGFSIALALYGKNRFQNG